MEELQRHRAHVAAAGVLKAIGECASRLMAGPQVARPFRRLTNGATHHVEHPSLRELDDGRRSAGCVPGTLAACVVCPRHGLRHPSTTVSK
jgi:hypothetical protein